MPRSSRRSSLADESRRGSRVPDPCRYVTTCGLLPHRRLASLGLLVILAIIGGTVKNAAVAGPAAASTQTFTFDASGYDPASVNLQLAQIDKPNTKLSDDILVVLNHDVLTPTITRDKPGWQTFDGTIKASTVSGKTVIVATIEGPDVSTQQTLWQGIIGALVAASLAAIAASACTFSLPPGAGAVCGAIGAYVATFVANMMGAYFDGKLYDPSSWANAVAYAIVFGLGAYLTGAYLIPWTVNGSLEAFVRTLGVFVGNALRTVGRFFGDYWTTLAEYAQNLVYAFSEYIGSAVVAAARKLGFLTSASAVDLRVMPLGDSITVGYGADPLNGYRLPLYDSLRTFGLGNNLNFVGNAQDGTACDPDDEGHGGYRIDAISGLADQTLAVHRPNVVLLQIGTNDMVQSTDLGNAPKRLGDLIDQILRDVPDAVVIVSTLNQSSDLQLDARMRSFNAAIPDITRARTSVGKHVILVSSADVGLSDLANSLHPAASGYRKMADDFENGIVMAALGGWIKAAPVTSDAPGGCVNSANAGQQVQPRTSPTRFADVNSDGKADYVTVDTTGKETYYVNKGGDRDTSVDGWEYHKLAYGVGEPNTNVTQFADVDGDGHPDYLSIDNKSGSVDAWLWSAGGWVQKGRIAYGVGMPTHGYIVMSDLNLDNRADYLIVNSDTNGVRMYGNDGPSSSGPWGWTDRGTIANGLAQGRRIEFADLNGDHVPDYLAVDQVTGAVDAWLNDGRGGWIEQKNAFAPVGGGGEFRFGDLNNDGKADILNISAAKVRVWLNTSQFPPTTGLLNAPKPTTTWSWSAQGQIAAGAGTGTVHQFVDLNGDGRADMTSAAPDGSVDAWYYNGGDFGDLSGWGTPTAGAPCPCGDRDEVRLADFNGDGRADYLRVSGDSSVVAYLNNGDGTWTVRRVAAGVAVPGSEVQFADVTGDGKADYLVVAPDSKVTAWRNDGGDGAGGFTSLGQFAAGVGVSGDQVIFADIDGDGKADYLAVQGSGAVDAYLNRGGDPGGGWGPKQRIAGGVGAPGNQVQFADINGDKHADYLTVDGSGRTRAWLYAGGDGTGPSGSYAGWIYRGQIANGVGVN